MAQSQDAKAKDQDAPAKAHPIPVRALQTGFYGGARIRKGTLFTIQHAHELGAWMERRDTPEAKAIDKAAAEKAQDEAKFSK